MKRWNGWGRTDYSYHFAESSKTFVEKIVGAGQQVPDASLETVLKKVPSSRLPENPSCTTDAEIRLRHARGQSFPDWVAMRYGTVNLFPDAVALPTSQEEIEALLSLAKQGHFNLIPYGGGTSVVGHINIEDADTPTLSVDLGNYNQLIHLDAISNTATFGAGVRGPDMEDALKTHGFRFGHYPQSHEFSTLVAGSHPARSARSAITTGASNSSFWVAACTLPKVRSKCHPSLLLSAAAGLTTVCAGFPKGVWVSFRKPLCASPPCRIRAFLWSFLSRLGKRFCRFARNGAGTPGCIHAAPLDRFETETTLQLFRQRKAGQSLADKGLRSLEWVKNRCMMLFAITGTAAGAHATLRKCSTSPASITVLSRRA